LALMTLTEHWSRVKACDSVYLYIYMYTYIRLIQTSIQR
jgi:hypothetical protein